MHELQRSVACEPRAVKLERFCDLFHVVARLSEGDALDPVDWINTRVARIAEPVEVRKAQPVEVRKLVEPELEASGLLETGVETAIEEDEELVDLGDDAAEIPGAGDEVAFVEDEEEGEADVSRIVGTPGEES